MEECLQVGMRHKMARGGREALEIANDDVCWILAAPIRFFIALTGRRCVSVPFLLMKVTGNM